MSSMRNAAPRRPHRERAQPAARSKWGLLEKHKDYTLRAQDYNVKKTKLSQLSRKVRERHPDEFAYGMMSKETGRQGKHGRGGDERSLGVDAVKLLKTQDGGYLRVVAGRGMREIRKVQEEIGMGVGRKMEGSKVVFDEPEEEVVGRGKKRDNNGHILQNAGVSEEMDVDFEIAGDVVEDENSGLRDEKPSAPKSKSKKALAAQLDAAARLKLERKKRKRLQEMRLRKLEALKTRQKEIMAAADQLDLQRAKMAGTVGGVNKNGVKFKIRERKR